MKTKKIVFRILPILLLILSSSNSFAYQLKLCGASGNLQFPTWQNPGSLQIGYVKADFALPEQTVLDAAINAWSRNRIGGTYLNITQANASNFTESYFEIVNNSTAFSDARKDELKFQFMQDDNSHLIYRRGTKDENGDWLNPQEDGQISSATLGWVTYRTVGGYCNNDTSSNIYWHPSMDIVIHRKGSGASPYFINSNEAKWGDFLPQAQRRDLHLVATHEIGHVIGLDHADEPFGAGSYNSVPALMLSTYQDQTNFHNGGNPMSYNNIRPAQPLGDELKGVSSKYGSFEPFRVDVALHSWEFARPYEQYLFKTRPQKLYHTFNSNGPFLTNPVSSSSRPYGGSHAGFATIQLHNLGLSGTNVGGFIRLRRTNNSLTGVGGKTEFYGWLNSRSFTKYYVSVKPPPASTSTPSFYALETEFYNSQIPGSDAISANNHDASGQGGVYRYGY